MKTTRVVQPLWKGHFLLHRGDEYFTVRRPRPFVPHPSPPPAERLLTSTLCALDSQRVIVIGYITAYTRRYVLPVALSSHLGIRSVLGIYLQIQPLEQMPTSNSTFNSSGPTITHVLYMQQAKYLEVRTCKTFTLWIRQARTMLEMMKRTGRTVEYIWYPLMPIRSNILRASSFI